LPITHLLLALTVVLVWGTNFVVIRWGLDGLPPFLFATLRFAFSALPWLLSLDMQGLVSPGLASLAVHIQVFFTIGLLRALMGERFALVSKSGACKTLLAQDIMDKLPDVMRATGHVQLVHPRHRRTAPPHTTVWPTGGAKPRSVDEPTRPETMATPCEVMADSGCSKPLDSHDPHLAQRGTQRQGRCVRDSWRLPRSPEQTIVEAKPATQRAHPLFPRQPLTAARVMGRCAGH